MSRPYGDPVHSRVPHETSGEATSTADAPDDLRAPWDEPAEPLEPHAPLEPDRPVALADTLWTKGHHPGRLVLRATSLLLLLAVGLNHLVTGRLGLFFDLVLVASCVLVALWVRPRDFFMVGVYPPIALGVVVVALAFADPAAVARASDPAGQAVVSGLAHHAVALVLGYGLTLGILALRQVALRHHGRLR